jgi:hypothetical protein
MQITNRQNGRKATGRAPVKQGRCDLWNDTVNQFRNDLKEMQELVSDPANDLFARIPQGTGQTLLREALLLADHNSNHMGSLILMGRILRG